MKIATSERFVGQQAIQLHGGFGMREAGQTGHDLRRLSVIASHPAVCVGRMPTERARTGSWTSRRPEGRP